MEQIVVVRRKKTWQERFFIISLLIFPLFQVSLFYIYLNIGSVTQAFKHINIDRTYRWVGLDNFKTVWGDLTTKGSLLNRGFWNNLIMFAVAWLISTPLSFLFAFVVYKKSPLTKTYRLLVMIPTIISAMLMGFIFKRFIEVLPKFGDKIGVSIPNFLDDKSYVVGTVILYNVCSGFATSMVIYPNVMNDIDREIVESARLEGVSALEELRYIVFPYLIPTFTTFQISSISALFAAGPLFVFWAYKAPSTAYTVGYHIFRETMWEGETMYGYSSAVHLFTLAITVPLTFIVKILLEKVDPLSD